MTKKTLTEAEAKRREDKFGWKDGDIVWDKPPGSTLEPKKAPAKKKKKPVAK